MMEEKTKRAFCVALDSNLEGHIKKAFIEISLKTLEKSPPVEDWQRFWFAVHNMEKALSVYDRLNCERLVSELGRIPPLRP